VGVTTKGHPFMLHMAYCEHGLFRIWVRGRSFLSEPGFLGNLSKFLRDRMGFLELAIASKVVSMRDIADGMAYLESRAFVHRDLACRFVGKIKSFLPFASLFFTVFSFFLAMFWWPVISNARLPTLGSPVNSIPTICT
jgi:hypothetical protein